MQSAPPQTQAIEKALTPLLAHRGFAVVLCSFAAKSKVLRLLIERSAANDDGTAQGVTLEDCTEVSRVVSDVLDGEGLLDKVGNYRLEVSSPGLDRPLTRPEHFVRFVGHKVQVRLCEPVSAQIGRKFVAQLEAANDASATLLPEASREPIQLDYSQIDSARLVPQV